MAAAFIARLFARKVGRDEAFNHYAKSTRLISAPEAEAEPPQLPPAPRLSRAPDAPAREHERASQPGSRGQARTASLS
jgi:hypothetical protein